MDIFSSSWKLLGTLHWYYTISCKFYLLVRNLAGELPATDVSWRFACSTLFHCGHRATWVNIGWGNGLLPDGNKLFPGPMLIHHQWSLAAFNWGQIHKRYLGHQTNYVPKISFTYPRDGGEIHRWRVDSLPNASNVEISVFMTFAE